MQRIVGVDPGIREVFYARGVDGSATHMSQGDFQSRAKLGSYTIQLASAVAAAGLHRLPTSAADPTSRPAWAIMPCA